MFSALIATTDSDEILDCKVLQLEKDADIIHHAIKSSMEKWSPDSYLAVEIEDDVNGVGKTDAKPIQIEISFLAHMLDLEKDLTFKFRVCVVI